MEKEGKMENCQSDQSASLQKPTKEEPKLSLYRVGSSIDRTAHLREKLKTHQRSSQQHDNLLKRMIREAARKAAISQERVNGFQVTEKFVCRELNFS